MKEKKRYILVLADGVPADEKALKTAAYDAVFEWLGDKGVSDARVQFIRAEPVSTTSASSASGGQNPAGSQFWLKCSTKSLEDVIAALALKRLFEGKDVALRVIKVAGSVPRVGPPRGKIKAKK
ncbi:hypothetical protein HY994_01550 [Candidatus Micrarchaeota archaeon]|nr:hypothetical protein [Candidatus Micrarchaeota archaeon]